MGPLVSVLTPSYAQARFIVDCLGSVAFQTYDNIEHIVQDGASSDGTVEILKAAASLSSRLSWDSRPDKGQADALNSCFAQASGDIIAWLNSDDGFFSPDTVKVVVAAFQRNPSFDIVYGDSAYVSETGQVLRHMRQRWSHVGNHFMDECPINQPSVFLRRSAIASDLLVDPSLQFGMDYDLWIRLALEGRKFLHLPTLLSFDRDHPARKVRTLRAIRSEEWSVLEGRHNVHLDLTETKLRRVEHRAGGLRCLLGIDPEKLPQGLSLPSKRERIARQLLRSHSGQART
jgi:glycosyltransferase involved in cell wall biosynthesis